MANQDFPTRIMYEFDGELRRCTVQKDQNNEFVVTVEPVQVYEDGKPVFVPVLRQKKDESGSAVLNEDNTPVMETVLNEDGSEQMQPKLDPISGRFIKFPANQSFMDFETWGDEE